MGAGPQVTASNGIRIHNMTKWRLGHVTNACTVSMCVSMCVCVCQYPCNTFQRERERDRQSHPHVMHTRVCLDYKQLQLRSPRRICIALQGNTHTVCPPSTPPSCCLCLVPLQITPIICVDSDSLGACGRALGDARI